MNELIREYYICGKKAFVIMWREINGDTFSLWANYVTQEHITDEEQGEIEKFLEKEIEKVAEHDKMMFDKVGRKIEYVKKSPLYRRFETELVFPEAKEIDIHPIKPLKRGETE